jgi:hypothetical protein
MERIAKKVKRRLAKAANRKVIPLEELRSARELSKALRDDAALSEATLQEIDDAGMQLAMSAQHVCSRLVEGLYELPELKRHAQLYEDLYDEFMPGLPPLSPVTMTFLQNLVLFDVGFGLDRESMGDILLSLAPLLKLPLHVVTYVQDLSAGHFALYRQAGPTKDDHQLLVDLVTGKEHRTLDCNGYEGKDGDLWLVRLVADHHADTTRHLCITTPYILTSGDEEWRAWLDRCAIGDATSYRDAMKPGPDRAFWLEFIMQGYAGVAPGNAAIFLRGVPDRADTRPHTDGGRRERLPESVTVAAAPSSEGARSSESAPEPICDCGTGKFRHHCCALPAEHDFQSVVTAFVEKNGPMASLDDANTRIAALQADYNEAPKRAFCGLSPAAMAAVLYEPFATPKRIGFHPTTTHEQHSDLFRVAIEMMRRIGKGRLKATGKGNLPLAACRELIPLFDRGGFDELILSDEHFRSEEDLPPLHHVRLLLEAAGLLTTTKGHFQLTTDGDQLQSDEHGSELFFSLFEAAATRFNWAYFDRYPDFDTIQRGWMFSLYLLDCYGRESRPAEFYARLFVDAFPQDLDDPDIGERDPVDALKRCYILRTFDRWAEPLGLCQIERRKRENQFGYEERVTATPLLGELLTLDLS